MKTLKEIINSNSTRYSKTENVLSENDAIESVKVWLMQKRQKKKFPKEIILIDELLEELQA